MTEQRSFGANADLDELLGAFALDAVDGDERDRVDEYVSTNAIARREIDDLRETAAMLALAPIEHVAAPIELFERIMGSIEMPVQASVTDLDAARERRRGASVGTWRAIAAVAAVAAVVVGVFGVQAGLRDDNELKSQFAATADRGSTLDLVGEAEARVALAEGVAVLELGQLPALGDDEVYQAWAVYPSVDAPVSVGVFGDDIDYAEFEYGDDLSAIAITVERGGGVVQSTNDPITVGALS